MASNCLSTQELAAHLDEILVKTLHLPHRTTRTVVLARAFDSAGFNSADLLRLGADAAAAKLAAASTERLPTAKVLIAGLKQALVQLAGPDADHDRTGASALEAEKCARLRINRCGQARDHKSQVSTRISSPLRGCQVTIPQQRKELQEAIAKYNNKYGDWSIPCPEVKAGFEAMVVDATITVGKAIDAIHAEKVQTNPEFETKDDSKAAIEDTQTWTTVARKVHRVAPEIQQPTLKVTTSLYKPSVLKELSTKKVHALSIQSNATKAIVKKTAQIVPRSSIQPFVTVTEVVTSIWSTERSRAQTESEQRAAHGDDHGWLLNVPSAAPAPNDDRAAIGEVAGACPSGRAHFTGAMMYEHYIKGAATGVFVEDQYSEYVGVGSYAHNSMAFPKAIASSFDAVAVDAGTRMTIYSEPNFKGRVLWERVGPAIVCNGGLHGPWVSCFPGYLHKVGTKAWKEPLNSIFPPRVREFSKEDMHCWSRGSCIISSAEAMPDTLRKLPGYERATFQQRQG